MVLRDAVVVGMTLVFASAAGAQQSDCNDSHTDGVQCFKRWDLQGFFYTVGETLTKSSSNIATELLPEGSVDVSPDPDAFPQVANVVGTYLYWSGSREEADTSVTLAIPGEAAAEVVADKCYLDSDNRVGSISKNFYACRADISGILKAGTTHFGTYTVAGVDAVILPGGNACTSTQDCYVEASKAAGKVFSACTVDGQEICNCDVASGTCDYPQQTVGHASFSLVFIYEHGAQTRSVFLYDGMQAFIAQTVDFDLTNVKTPSTPDNPGALAYYIVEGDNDDVTAHPFVPDALAVKEIDNPGEKVTLQWGTDLEFSEPIELESLTNPIWDDPFNGTTGAGVDIESYPLVVPAAQTQARLIVHSPNIDSVNEYADEVCTDPATNNQCGVGHQCECLLQDAGSPACAQYGCIDQFANDGIGVAYVVVGFDVFAPSLVNADKASAIESDAGGVAFSGDINGDAKLSPGEQVQFALKAGNVGSSLATDFKLIDPLPPELVFSGFNGDPLQAFAEYEGLPTSGQKTLLYTAATTGEGIEVSLADLEIGETVTVYFNAIINPGYAWEEQGKVIFNQARFEAEFIDPVVTDWSGKPGPDDRTEIAVIITDIDDDGLADHIDNCPTVANPDQADMDNDGQGDVCDDDKDGDSFPNDEDSCPENPEFWLPTDVEQCADDDGDGVPDAKDNCPEVANPDQKDTDSDATTGNCDPGECGGDACDPDLDGDGLRNDDEINKHGTNPNDADTDDDGVSDGDELKGVTVDTTEGDKVFTGLDPLKCDTDGDGLPDGLEVGVVPSNKLADTATCATGDTVCEGQCHFIGDLDSSTITDPADADTDDGGIPDGEEDFNKNGRVDGDELDPLDPSDDRVIAGGSTLIGCEASHRGGSAPLALLIVGLLALAALRRGRGIALLAAIVTLGTFVTPSDALAQDPTEVFYKPFKFAGNSKGLLTTESGELEGHFDWHLALGLDYASKPVTVRSAFDTDQVVQDVVSQRVNADLVFALGLGGWFELDFYLPLVVFQEGNDPFSGEAIQSFAVSDFTLTPKFRIAGSRRGGGFLTLLVPVTFPTGKAMAGSYAQEPFITARPTLAMSAGRRVTWAMNLGAVIREGTDRKAVQNNMEFTFSTGFAFGLIPDTSYLLLDIYGNTQFDDFFGSESGEQHTTGLEGLLGYRHRFRNFYFTVGGGLGVLGGRGVPEWRALAMLNYATELLDSDGDGIGDDDDLCPEDPEDFDKWQDVDGCPDPDNDNDGIVDARDDCPNEPEDIDGFQDADGCPEQDNDRDGVLDTADGCPLQPEDLDGFEDRDGCPELDNDKDGIADAADKCPLKPEDRDGFEDEDGCPELDNDKDGLVDTRDTCPNEPENFNGYKDEDGCPDVVFTCTEFKIGEKVFFKTGSARIQPKSFPLLKVVAETIIKHPEAALSEVQGHTDKRGSRRYNTKLSDRRAKSVADYLGKHGVPRDRLVSRGYGFDKPLEEGKDGKEYYDQNRRVQLIVLKLDPTKSERCRK